MPLDDGRWGLADRGRGGGRGGQPHQPRPDEPPPIEHPLTSLPARQPGWSASHARPGPADAVRPAGLHLSSSFDPVCRILAMIACDPYRRALDEPS